MFCCWKKEKKASKFNSIGYQENGKKFDIEKINYNFEIMKPSQVQEIFHQKLRYDDSKNIVNEESFQSNHNLLNKNNTSRNNTKNMKIDMFKTSDL